MSVCRPAEASQTLREPGISWSDTVLLVSVPRTFPSRCPLSVPFPYLLVSGLSSPSLAVNSSVVPFINRSSSHLLTCSLFPNQLGVITSLLFHSFSAGVFLIKASLSPFPVSLPLSPCFAAFIKVRCFDLSPEPQSRSTDSSLTQAVTEPPPPPSVCLITALWNNTGFCESSVNYPSEYAAVTGFTTEVCRCIYPTWWQIHLSAVWGGGGGSCLIPMFCCRSDSRLRLRLPLQ